MGIEAYLFALFVFGLVLIVLFLIFKGMKEKLKDEQADYEEKMNKLMVTYFEIEDMANSLKDYIAHTSAELELDYKKIAFEASKIAYKAEENMAYVEEVAEQKVIVEESKPFEELVFKKAEEEAEISLQDKANLVLELVKKGKTEDQIAEELSISKAEIRFMAKVNK